MGNTGQSIAYIPIGGLDCKDGQSPKFDWAQINRKRFQAVDMDLGFELRDNVLDPESYISWLVPLTRRFGYPLAVHLGYTAAFGIEKRGKINNTLSKFVDGLRKLQHKHTRFVVEKVSLHPSAFQLSEEKFPEGNPFVLRVEPEQVLEAIENHIPALRDFVKLCGPEVSVELENVHPYLYWHNGLPMYYAGQLGGLDIMYLMAHVPGLGNVVDIAHKLGWDKFYRGQGEFQTSDTTTLVANEVQRILEAITGVVFEKNLQPRTTRKMLSIPEYLRVFRPDTIHLDFCDKETVIEDGVELFASHLEPNLDIDWHKRMLTDIMKYARPRGIDIVPEPAGKELKGISQAGRAVTSWQAQINTFEAILTTCENIDSGKW